MECKVGAVWKEVTKEWLPEYNQWALMMGAFKHVVGMERRLSSRRSEITDNCGQVHVEEYKLLRRIHGLYFPHLQDSGD